MKHIYLSDTDLLSNPGGLYTVLNEDAVLYVKSLLGELNRLQTTITERSKFVDYFATLVTAALSDDGRGITLHSTDEQQTT